VSPTIVEETADGLKMGIARGSGDYIFEYDEKK
jgi:hypothetical protein